MNINNNSENEMLLNVKPKIKTRPDNPDKIGQEVTRQWLRIGLLFVIIFIIIIVLLKEYLEYLKIIKTMSITQFLMKN